MKTETGNLLTINNSDNILIAGITANGYPKISLSGASNVAIACWGYFADGGWAGVFANGTTSITNDGTTYPIQDAFSLFKIGSYDEAPFP
jgi:hypothetical protein